MQRFAARDARPPDDCSLRFVSRSLIEDALAPLAKVDYVDVYTPMLDATGKPRVELFRKDRLHTTADGYAIWRKVVAPVLEQDQDVKGPIR